MPDGNIFVAVKTEMPKATGDMLDWWFWWHPINGLRCKVWYPEAHFGISIDQDMNEYSKRKGPYTKRYWNTPHYHRRYWYRKGNYSGPPKWDNMLK